MPPLERHSFSPVAEQAYVSVYGNHVLEFKGNAKDVFCSAPLTNPTDFRIPAEMVLSQRGVIMGTNPLYEHNLSEPETRHPKRSLKSLLDVFANLCVCQEAVADNNEQLRKLARANRKRVVYPIAKYPGKLDDESLVEKRRKSLQDHLFFRPVTDENVTKKVKLEN
jgi:hypothetical protein